MVLSGGGLAQAGGRGGVGRPDERSKLKQNSE